MPLDACICECGKSGPTGYKQKANKIYNVALYTLLINGYRLPLNKEFLNPFLYFRDMVMFGYFYQNMINEPISSRNLAVSSSCLKNVPTLEQSGYGNILGIRRETSGTCHFVLEETEDGRSRLRTRMNREAYTIPYVCRDTVAVLATTMKNNPFLFRCEKEMISSEDNIKEFENDIKKFLKEYQEALRIFEGAYPLMGSYTHYDNSNEMKSDKLAIYPRYMRINEESVDVSRTYSFYNSYYNKLGKIEKITAEPDEQNNRARAKANRYLSELLFAYTYYIESFLLLEKDENIQMLDDKAYEEILNVVYKVSESPACFARREHIKQYLKERLKLHNDQIRKTGKRSWENQVMRNERYTTQKFLPALYYCFLFYAQKVGIITNDEFKGKKAPIIQLVVNFDKEYIFMEDKIKKREMTEWMESRGAKLLWERRRVEFFEPLKYKKEYSLFYLKNRRCSDVPI